MATSDSMRTVEASNELVLVDDEATLRKSTLKHLVWQWLYFLYSTSYQLFSSMAAQRNLSWVGPMTKTDVIYLRHARAVTAVAPVMIDGELS